MLSPRMMTVLGTGVAVAGVLAYAFVVPQTLDPLIVGVALGASIVIAGHVAGGPRPVPPEGYTFPDAMALMHRASLGALVVAGTVIGLGFVLWGRERLGGFEVLVLFSLGLLLLYASILAAAGLVHVAKRTGEEAGTPAGQAPGEPEPAPPETPEG